MALSTDPNTTDALSRIVQLYNADELPDNQLNDAEFSFSNPSVNTDTNKSPRNTLVVASAYATSGKIGKTRIYYNRQSLADLPSPPTIVIAANTTLADVVAQLNDYYGLNIVAADYDTTASVAGTSVTIVAKATSYLFIGQITLTFAV